MSIPQWRAAADPDDQCRFCRAGVRQRAIDIVRACVATLLLGRCQVPSLPQPSSIAARLPNLRLRRIRACALTLLGLLVTGFLALGFGYWIYSLPKDELLPFRENFETGDLRQWDRLGWKQLCCEHSLRVVTDPVRSGRYAARFELVRGDPL